MLKIGMDVSGWTLEVIIGQIAESLTRDDR